MRRTVSVSPASSRVLPPAASPPKMRFQIDMLGPEPSRPHAAPSQQAARHPTSVAATYARAAPVIPPASCAYVSKLNAEYVVKPPSTPLASAVRASGEG